VDKKAKQGGAWRAAQIVGGVAVGAVVAAAGYVVGLDKGEATVHSAAAVTTTVTVPTVVTRAVAPAETSVAAPPAPAQPAVKTSFGEGIYVVGEDMPVGTYRTEGSGEVCYWARLKNSNGGPGAIIDNHLGAGPSQFAPQKGELVQIDRCTYTKK
jgi:hypothetical protein